jgi:hypothetical protein
MKDEDWLERFGKRLEHHAASPGPGCLPPRHASGLGQRLTVGRRLEVEATDRRVIDASTVLGDDAAARCAQAGRSW